MIFLQQCYCEILTMNHLISLLSEFGEDPKLDPAVQCVCLFKYPSVEAEIEAAKQREDNEDTTDHVTPNSGDVTADNGDVAADNDDVTADNGDVTANSGDVTADICDVTADNDDVMANSGDVTASADGVTAGIDDDTTDASTNVDDNTDDAAALVDANKGNEEPAGDGSDAKDENVDIANAYNSNIEIEGDDAVDSSHNENMNSTARSDTVEDTRTSESMTNAGLAENDTESSQKPVTGDAEEGLKEASPGDQPDNETADQQNPVDGEEGNTAYPADQQHNKTEISNLRLGDTEDTAHQRDDSPTDIQEQHDIEVAYRLLDDTEKADMDPVEQEFTNDQGADNKSSNQQADGNPLANHGADYLQVAIASADLTEIIEGSVEQEERNVETTTDLPAAGEAESDQLAVAAEADSGWAAEFESEING